MTITTTTLPVTVVCSIASPIAMTVTMDPTSVGLPIMGQHDLVLHHSWSWEIQWGVLLASPLWHSNNNLSSTCQLCHRSSTGKFLFQSWVSHQFICYMLVSVFCFQVPIWLPNSPMGFNHWGMHHYNPFEYTLARHVSPKWLHLIGGRFMIPIQLSSGHSISMLEHTTLSTWQSHLILQPSLHGGEESSFSDCFPPNDMVFLICAGHETWWFWFDHVDEFTCPWLAEYFIAESHIYPGFAGKVSALTHLPLDPGCQDYSFFRPSSWRNWANVT